MRVLLQSQLEFGLGRIQFLHFIEQLPVMDKRADFGLLFDERRHLAGDFFAGNRAALVGEQLLVAAPELNGRALVGSTRNTSSAWIRASL